MTHPRLVTVFFPPGPDGRYDAARLLRAYVASAKAHDVNLEVIQIDTPPVNARARWMDENTAKLAVWSRIVQETTTPVIITDADFLMLNPPVGAFDDFPGDIGVTFRARARVRMPLNGGTFFARPTPAAREFMHLWVDVNQRMMEDETFHTQWMGQYAGINQASLGYLIETNRLPCSLVQMPCRQWNAVDEDWPYVHLPETQTRFLHIKGALRRECLKTHLQSPHLVHLAPEAAAAAELWRYYDRLAGGLCSWRAQGNDIEDVDPIWWEQAKIAARTRCP